MTLDGRQRLLGVELAEDHEGLADVQRAQVEALAAAVVHPRRHEMCSRQRLELEGMPEAFAWHRRPPTGRFCACLAGRWPWAARSCPRSRRWAAPARGPEAPSWADPRRATPRPGSPRCPRRPRSEARSTPCLTSAPPGRRNRGAGPGPRPPSDRRCAGSRLPTGPGSRRWTGTRLHSRPTASRGCRRRWGGHRRRCRRQRGRAPAVREPGGGRVQPAPKRRT